MSSEGKVKREEASDDNEAPIKKDKKVQASLSTCLLVTVDFKDVALREKIKGLGATWCKPLSGWILPESARAAAQTYVDGGEPTAADVARASGGDRGSSLEDPEPTANANAKLVISPHKKAIMVSYNKKAIMVSVWIIVWARVLVHLTGLILPCSAGGRRDNEGERCKGVRRVSTPVRQLA